MVKLVEKLEVAIEELEGIMVKMGKDGTPSVYINYYDVQAINDLFKEAKDKINNPAKRNASGRTHIRRCKHKNGK